MSSHILEEPKVGTFSIASGKVMVSDPCYEPGTWCQGSLDNVKNGKWDAYVGRFGDGHFGMRCTDLTVVHNEYSSKYERDKWAKDDESMVKYYEEKMAGLVAGEQNEEVMKKIESCKDSIEHHSPLKWEKTDIDVGVDSGQAGVFDFPTYKGRPEDEERGDWDNNPKSFYDWCCHTTGKWPNAGCIEGGAVSSSGFGDGGYSCYVAKRYNEIVGIKIVFIGGPDEDEEDDDYGEDDHENDESPEA